MSAYYVINNNNNKTDLLVIGSGISGCTTALHAADNGKRVMIITSSIDPLNSTSYLAQGGIIYKALDEPNEAKLFGEDIRRAGAYLSDEKAIEKITQQGPEVVEKFLLGGREKQPAVPFDRSSTTGQLSLCLEASHSRPRILHWSDCTGKAIMENLIQAVSEHPNIELRCDTMAVDLLISTRSAEAEEEDDEHSLIKYCTGAMLLSQGVVQSVTADNVIMATGGCGDLFANTSNPSNARGDGIAIALRAGASVKNMEYLQFHPTTFYSPGEKSFLLTEALRGEGALLRDPISKELFSKNYHESGELAPRDVVSRMIVSQMQKSNAKFVYLDITHLDESFLSKRFPSIYAHLLQRGFNLAKDLIPVVPAAHYSCGGIEVDVNGQSSIPHLYAIGEVSCTGLHGANRLASTSLLEGMVWGVAAVDNIDTTANNNGDSSSSLAASSPSSSIDLIGSNDICVGDSCNLMMENQDKLILTCDDSDDGAFDEDSTDKIWLEQSWLLLRDLMWHKVGIVRNQSSLKYAVAEIEVLANQAEDAFQAAFATSLFLSSNSSTSSQFDSSNISNISSMDKHFSNSYCLNDDEYWLTKKDIKDDILLLEKAKQTLPYQYCKFNSNGGGYLFSKSSSSLRSGLSSSSQNKKWVELLGFRNSCLTALTIAKSAQKNKVSSGAHYIEPNGMVDGLIHVDDDDDFETKVN